MRVHLTLLPINMERIRTPEDPSGFPRQNHTSPGPAQDSATDSAQNSVLFPIVSRLWPKQVLGYLYVDMDSLTVLQRSRRTDGMATIRRGIGQSQGRRVEQKSRKNRGLNAA